MSFLLKDLVDQATGKNIDASHVTNTSTPATIKTGPAQINGTQTTDKSSNIGAYIVIFTIIGLAATVTILLVRQIKK